ncbi:hypothetical protein BU25DRAFT_406181 [Macroventuria anomochaeta]|uniref:Uncharacterized protein n=1 Tax=Macroventuria anomochaeta TaxID=301207 RepID=A0ACB6SF57_9PLEO|nr:uncharacterized protein BU25DRAFT_406181 [Macroventuria anomochaeta]KAF2632866.1 hypothetical protein BU25DRAFT_406181 [Macroventuria anomochaeta]
MDLLRLPSVTRLATLSLLTLTFAQNNINTTDINSDQSALNFDSNAPINATGSLNLHWTALMMDPARNDWTFTLTYNETRNQNGTTHRWESYMSVPEISEAKACTFMLAGLNKTSASAQRNGCDGVLDDVCTDVLRGISWSGDRCSFPFPDSEYSDRVLQACGVEILERNVCYNTYPIDFSKSTCSRSHPPGSSSPENWRTFGMTGMPIDWVNVNSDRNTSDFTWYDTFVKQTVPFVVAMEFLGGIAETQVLCVAPKNIAEGSRVPAQKSMASERWRPTSWMATAAALYASTVVMLT